MVGRLLIGNPLQKIIFYQPVYNRQAVLALSNYIRNFAFET